MDVNSADLVVVGAGPAGVAAAVEASGWGLDVVLVDEGTGARLAGDRRGERLRRALGRSSVRGMFGRVVWSVTPGFRVEMVGAGGIEAVEAPRVVAATGAVERTLPFPGWTLAGVVGLGEELAGGRVVVAGCGPLLAAAAGLPGLVAVVDLAAGEAVRRAEGDVALAQVLVGAVDGEGRAVGEGRWIEADALRVGYGWVPGVEVTGVLRAGHRFDGALGGWVPVLDGDGRTGVPGLYAAGGGAAALAGRLAGRAVAADAGRAVADAGTLRRAVRRGMPVVDPGLIRVWAGLLEGMPLETVVCRCEGVTRGAIEGAIGAGAREINQVKAFTRCGMGACQGRVCGEAVAGLLARHVGGREAAGRWTVRPPLRPVPLAALVGRFVYSDIPVPAPAPL